MASGGFPMVGSYGSSRYVFLNCGQQGFTYTPPTGYKALNSANLPDPTINFGNQHFNTILYTANGQVRSLTGVGFQPDWVWIKSRIGGQNNALFDSVRGVNRQLRSDTSGQEISNRTNLLTSFDSDGFSLGTDSNVGDVNYNSQPHVAWNWNAGNTDSATYTVKVVSDSGNKYRFNDFGTSAVTLDLAEGGTYTFDGSDSSMSGHPFVIGTAANGSVYSTGVIYQLDGASVTYSAYTSGYSSATTRKLIITVPASAPQLYYWCSLHSGMGGAINTNTSLGSSNFDGSIQSTVKVNTTAGFSIVTYTGTAANATIGHGLGVKPEAVLLKRRTGGDSDWMVFHKVTGNTKNLRLNLSGGTHTTSNIWNNTDPTSSAINIGTSSAVNASGSTYVAYVLSGVTGDSKFGSYNGNGNANGPFIFTGFRPAWVMTVIYSSSGFDWAVHDSTRNPFNLVDRKLNPNNNAQEQTDYDKYDFLSNGFKPRVSDPGINASTGSYVYFAFAESPFKHARAR